MVRQKQYILNDAFTGDRLDIVAGGTKRFLPGQVVQMSMCFGVRGQTLGSCPRCGSNIAEANNGEITWYDDAKPLKL